jgi:hypothetical protein
MVLSANSFTGGSQAWNWSRDDRATPGRARVSSPGTRHLAGPRPRRAPARAKDLPDVRRAGARRGENSPLLRTQIRRCGREAGIANRSLKTRPHWKTRPDCRGPASLALKRGAAATAPQPRLFAAAIDTPNNPHGVLATRKRRQAQRDAGLIRDRRSAEEPMHCADAWQPLAPLRISAMIRPAKNVRGRTNRLP